MDVVFVGFSSNIIVGTHSNSPFTTLKIGKFGENSRKEDLFLNFQNMQYLLVFAFTHGITARGTFFWLTI
jgi:hypothetical protein